VADAMIDVIRRENKMGQLTNSTQVGDPLNEVAVFGFNTKEDACQFLQQNFHFRRLTPTFHVTLARGDHVSFQGQPYVVFFYLASDGQLTLLSITQCFGDLPNLNIRSLGAQMLLSA
jgi:hypothetical protein